MDATVKFPLKKQDPEPESPSSNDSGKATVSEAYTGEYYKAYFAPKNQWRCRTIGYARASLGTMPSL